MTSRATRNSAKNVQSPGINSKHDEKQSQGRQVKVIDMENINKSSKAVCKVKPSMSGHKRSSNIDENFEIGPKKVKRGRAVKSSKQTEQSSNVMPSKQIRSSKGLARSNQNSQETNSQDEESDYETEKQFQEEGNYIEMKVNAGEDNFSSDEDEEEGLASESETNNDSTDAEQDNDSPETVTDCSEDNEDSQRNTSPCHRRKRGKCSQKRMEEKIDHLSNALAAVQNLIVQQGIVDKTPNKGKKNKDNAGETLITNSETTIYENTVLKVNSDEDSETNHEIVLNFDKAKPVLSDDPEADTSEELMNVTDQFIADCAADAERHRSRESSKQPNEYVPSRGESMVQEVEDAKLRIIATPGNDCLFPENVLLRKMITAWS